MIEAEGRADSRISTLERLGAVSPEADHVLQGITDDARELFGTTLCVLHLMLRDSLYFRAWSGTLPGDFEETREISSENSMCPNVILTEKPLVVTDLAGSEEYRDHFVCTVGGLRFYAGVPLITSGGQTIGSLCLLGLEPGEFGDRDLATLSALGRAAVGRLELLSALASERNSRNEVSRILDDSLDIIVSMDFEGRIQKINRACYAVLGYTPEELLGVEHSSIIHPDDQDKILEASRKLYNGDPVHRCEGRYIRKDGGITWLEWSATPALDEGIYHCVARDITFRKTTESELCRQRDLYETLLDAQSSVGECFAVVEGESIIYVNEALAGMLGYEVEELMALPSIFDVIPDEHREFARSRMMARLSGEISDSYVEYTLLHRSGRRVYVELGIQMLGAASGARFVLVGRETTERRMAEAERLRMSDELRLLLESTGEGIFGIDREGFCTFINRAASGMLGYSPDEVLGKNMHAMIHHSYADGSEFPESLCPMTRASVTGDEFVVEEGAFWHRNGGRLIVEYSAHPVLEDGERRGAVVTFSDIAERKDAENALKLAEEKYRSIFENAVEGIFQSTVEGKFVTANPAMARILGYDSPEELLNDVDSIEKQLFVNPNRRKDLVRQMSEDGYVTDFVSQARRRDGWVIWVSANVTLRYDQDGEAVGYEGTLEDVTERKHLEEKLQSSERRFKNVVEQAADAIFIHDHRGNFVDVNQRACEMSGYTREQLLSMSVKDLEVGIKETDFEDIWSVTSRNDFLTLEGTHLTASGSLIPIEVRLGGFESEGSRYVLALARDITERKRAEESRAQFHTVFEKAPVGMFLADSGGYITESNPRFQEMLGYTESELHDMTFRDITHSEDVEGNRTRFKDLVEGRISGYKLEKRYVQRGGDEIWVHLTVSAMRDEQDDFSYCVAMVEDITEQRAFQQRLAHLATHDPLTDLPNRMLFSNRLEESLVRSTRTNLRTALLYLDLDDFKEVNDSRGHQAGDELLVEVSRRLTSCLRETDTAARLGGDEFAVLLEDIPNAPYVSLVLDRVTATLSDPFLLQGQRVPVRASIGFAIAEPGERSPAKLLREADRAMYLVKADRKLERQRST